MPSRNTDPQGRQRINEAVQRLISSLFAVPDDFLTPVHPFFNLLLSSKLLCLSQIVNFGVIGEMHGTGKRITPWQMLDVFEGGASAGGRGGGAAAGPRTTASTSKSVDLPTAAQAAEAVKAIFQDKLGRDPDDGDLSRYSGISTAGAKASPTITKTTQTVDANGNSTSSSTSSGGFTQADAQHLLTEQAEKDPEYGAYQAATFYHDTLLRALAAPA